MDVTYNNFLLNHKNIWIIMVYITNKIRFCTKKTKEEKHNNNLS